MPSPVAVDTLTLPHSRLKSVRSELLRSLMLADAAKSRAEANTANDVFRCAIAQAHKLGFRASFYVVKREGRRLPLLEVCFTADPKLTCETLHDLVERVTGVR